MPSYPDIIYIISATGVPGQNTGDSISLAPKAASNQLQFLRTDHRIIKDSGSYDYSMYDNRFLFPIVNIVVN